MDPRMIGYAEWYKNKRRADNTECQRARRARANAEKAASLAEEYQIVQQAESTMRKTLERYSRQFQKESATHSRNIAIFTVKELAGLSEEAQRVAIEKFISHPLVERMLPQYLSNLTSVKYEHKVLCNIKAGMTTHCKGAKKDERIVAKDIVCTFAAGPSMGSSRGVAKVLGVDIRNVKKGMERRLQLDLSDNAFWVNYKRATRATFISKEMKDVIVDWWVTESTISPNHKDIVRNRIAVKKFEEHATHYLQVSQVSIHHLYVITLICLYRERNEIFSFYSKFILGSFECL